MDKLIRGLLPNFEEESNKSNVTPVIPKEKLTKKTIRARKRKKLARSQKSMLLRNTKKRRSIMLRRKK